MGRLFAGTKWDRPPTCERCGVLESECRCPPPEPPPRARLDPSTQTARLRVEKRPKGKVATVVRGLDSQGNDLPALLAQLKSTCGCGGALQSDFLELQGDHAARVETFLLSLGYRVKRG